MRTMKLSLIAALAAIFAASATVATAAEPSGEKMGKKTIAETAAAIDPTETPKPLKVGLKNILENSFINNNRQISNNLYLVG